MTRVTREIDNGPQCRTGFARSPTISQSRRVEPSKSVIEKQSAPPVFCRTRICSAVVSWSAAIAFGALKRRR